MDFFSFADRQFRSIVDHGKTFFGDVLRLLKASPVFGGIVVATGIVLGLGPILFWQFFSRFLDASFASRGVGTVTSDLTHSAFALCIVIGLLSLAMTYFLQTKSLSRRIVTTIALSMILATHVVVLVPVSKAFLLFLCILGLAFHVIRQRPVIFAIGIVLFLLAMSTVTDVLFMMTRRSFTVGAMMEYVGVIFSLTIVVGCLAHRQLKNRA